MYFSIFSQVTYKKNEVKQLENKQDMLKLLVSIIFSYIHESQIKHITLSKLELLYITSMSINILSVVLCPIPLSQALTVYSCLHSLFMFTYSLPI